MNAVNYRRLLDEELKKITAAEKTPSLLLHSCCAPCSSYVLEYLSRYFSITVLFYNPNISPRAEFDYRLSEIGRLISEMPFENPVSLIESAYDHDRYLEAVRGFENEPEGGLRCERCFRLRLTQAAAAAKELECDYFTTTLSISPLKSAALLNEIGGELSREYGVKYLYSDFKKRDGYKRSIELSHEYGLYRQNYCGCAFSKGASMKTEDKDE